MSEIINKMVKFGEFIIINNNYQYNSQENIDNLTVQTALMLSGNKKFFGFDINKDNNKILFIDSSGKSQEVFFKICHQLGEDVNNERYNNIKVIDLDLNLLLNASGIENLTQIIENEDFDIIVWNNINLLYEFYTESFKRMQLDDNPLEHLIYVIKKISGMKTKVISHLYNAVLEKNEFKKINDISTSSISLSHTNIIEGYQIIFSNKHNKNKSITKVEKFEDKDLFIFKNQQIFINGVLINDVKLDDQNPFSY